MWWNFQAFGSQFEAEVEWERLLIAKNSKVQNFAARFARELSTASPRQQAGPDHLEIAYGGPGDVYFA